MPSIQSLGTSKNERDILIETPFPTTAGKFPEVAATVCPAAPVVTPPDGLKKLKTS
jgi:hypothetical protein